MERVSRIAIFPRAIQKSPSATLSRATKKLLNSVGRESLRKKTVGCLSVEREASKRNRRCLLDTNFILSCIRKKIDFFYDLKYRGFQIMIPLQVINELKTLEGRNEVKLSMEAGLALKLLKNKRFQRIDIHDDKVDRGIVKFSQQNKDVIIATLDKELREKLNSRTMIIKGRTGLEVV